MSGPLSWIGESALGVGAAAALSEANVDSVDALLYLGQSKQQHARMRTLLCQCHGSCRDSNKQPESQHEGGTAENAIQPSAQVEAACDQHREGCPAEASACLWLPIKPAKLDKRHGLDRQLAQALRFISGQRKHGRSVLICDDDGADACVCMALAAMLCRGLDVEGCETSSGGRSVSAVIHGVKAAARTHLAEISSFHPSARPTRTALKQVYGFVGGVFAAQPGPHALSGSNDAETRDL